MWIQLTVGRLSGRRVHRRIEELIVVGAHGEGVGLFKASLKLSGEGLFEFREHGHDDEGNKRKKSNKGAEKDVSDASRTSGDDGQKEKETAEIIAREEEGMQNSGLPLSFYPADCRDASEMSSTRQIKSDFCLQTILLCIHSFAFLLLSTRIILSLQQRPTNPKIRSEPLPASMGFFRKGHILSCHAPSLGTRSPPFHIGNPNRDPAASAFVASCGLSDTWESHGPPQTQLVIPITRS